MNGITPPASLGKRPHLNGSAMQRQRQKPRAPGRGAGLLAESAEEVGTVMQKRKCW